MLKRVFDIFLSIILLISLSPLFVFISIIIIIIDGKPIFFKQERPGYKEKLFTIIKFRTMSNPITNKNKTSDDHKRLTKLGRWLRKTSIDELPSLVNIIKGEMSFIGPRPLLTKYLPLYSRDQARRHNVKPGLSGLAQINGRNLLSWEDKLNYDIYYVDNNNLFLDFEIFFKTILLVIKKEGISPKGFEIMPEFKNRTQSTKNS